MNENFLSQVLNYEALGVSRKALQALTAPEIKEIDGQRKEIRESIIVQIKSIGAIDGCKACNAICPTVHGADNTARQALSRRRNWLKSLLSKTHTDYDFNMADGTIFADYVGDATKREAKTLFATLERLKTFDIDLYDMSLKDMEYSLRTESKTSEATIADVETGASVTMVNSVLDRITALSAKMVQDGESIEAEAEAQS